MSGPSAYLTLPESRLLKWWPDNIPQTLPAPADERTLRAPFAIDPQLYNFLLQWPIPFAFAALYMFSVFALNAYNSSRDGKPWRISKWKAFKCFVVVHNALLAVYSAATFFAMLRAIAHTWPGINGSNGLAGAADALCKMHGPRGLGDAATFNLSTNTWEIKNQLIKLGADFNPDATDVGRLWNEGLAFWGWMFYVSKFYEVLDTLIVLAKGKRSATLQTYHHAGAMICVWAGIRYMSPPIWMFVFINSAIHTMMYTYFAFSALRYRIPQSVKRTLTTLQIAQIVFGASYAAAHLFVKYDIPIQTPYQIATTISSAVASASSAVSSVAENVAEVATSGIPPRVTESFGAWLRKLALRAAGEEGVAENVYRNTTSGELLSPGMEEKVQAFNEKTIEIYETRYRDDWHTIRCIDTTGEAFAIWLNLLYLVPLALLFVRFFVKAYTQRGKNRPASQIAREAGKDARQSARKTNEKVEQIGKDGEDMLTDLAGQAEPKMKELSQQAKDVSEQMKQDVTDMKAGKYRDRRVSERVQSFEGKIKKAFTGSESEGGSGSGTPKRKQNGAGNEEENAIGYEPEDKKSDDGEENGESKLNDDDQRLAESQQTGDSALKQEGEAQDELESKDEEITHEGQSEDDAKTGVNDAGGTVKSQEKATKAKKQQSDVGKKADSGKPSPAENSEKSEQDDGKSTSQAMQQDASNPDDKPSEGDDKENTAPATGGASKAESGDNDTAHSPSQDDTDAMGKSGSIIDLAAEKAKDANAASGKTKDNNQEELSPAAGTDDGGAQRKPPSGK